MVCADVQLHFVLVRPKNFVPLDLSLSFLQQELPLVSHEGLTVKNRRLGAPVEDQRSSGSLSFTPPTEGPRAPTG